jgi:hypothetical protein
MVKKQEPTPAQEGPNFECLCKDGSKQCTEVFETKQQLSAHIRHGHKVKVSPTNWRKTSKPVTKPRKQKQAAATLGGFGGSNGRSGTLTVPILLTFDFAFSTPMISQEIPIQHIDLSSRGRRGRRSNPEEPQQ